MVFHVPTSVTAVIFIGVAVSIALTVSIVTRRAMRFVTAASVRVRSHRQTEQGHLRSRPSEPDD